jgi:drug/metabolite transporter (DMT)-like permease
MPQPASRARIAVAFAAIYIIWGSTYLGILFAIETLPPFLMAGSRFLTAGALIFAWSWPRRERNPTIAEWKAAAIIGGLLLLGGNGAVSWAEQYVPSSIAALLIAVTPLWMVLLDWLWHGAVRPGSRTIAGVLLGIAGLGLLVGPAAIMGAGAVHVPGALVILGGSLSWSIGSIYSRRAPTPKGGMLGIGMQMLAGGALLLLLGLLSGEAGRLDLAQVSLKSALAVAYLTVFGSIIGYSAYIWLLRVVSAARVATYAYVNPIVAVLLGWALAGEVLTVRMLVAAAVIVIGVALITPGSRGSARRSDAALMKWR